MNLELTDKGAMAVSNYMFNSAKELDPEEPDELILAKFIGTALIEEDRFIKLIKISLLQVGMKLMNEEGMA